MPLWVILFYCICSFGNDSKLIYDFLHHHSSNLFFYIFTIVEYSLFAAFIYTILHKVYLKRALLICSPLFIGFCLFNIFFQPNAQFDSLQASIGSLILLIFCILYLFEQISKPEPVFIYASYTFWVVAGILIYLAATFFLYGFAASLPAKVVRQYWIINSLGNILKNIFFATAFIIYVKRPKTTPPERPVENEYQPFLN